ncbi:MAG: hypothetical protein ACOCV1_06720 [Bacillota bacterium]
MMKNKQKIVDELCEMSAKRPDGKRELTFEQIAAVIEKNADIPRDKIKMILDSLISSAPSKLPTITSLNNNIIFNKFRRK